MTMNVKLLLSALGLLAAATAPAMAKTHYLHADRSEIARAVPPVVGSAGPYAYEPGSRASSQASGDVYRSYSQGSQPYPNPDRVPLDATTEPF
jgi:hypothetical protein